MLAGSESSKFRACGSNIYDPNSRGTLPWMSATTTDSTNIGSGSIRWAKGDTTKGSIKKDAMGTMYDPRIDLSWSNSIFGASETVQTASLRGYWLIRF
mgnify:CR=1 FL=1